MIDNNEILKQTIEKYKLNLGNNFEFMGGTIIQRSEFLTYTEILFCEDGLVDENKVPYKYSLTNPFKDYMILILQNI